MKEHCNKSLNQNSFNIAQFQTLFRMHRLKSRLVLYSVASNQHLRLYILQVPQIEQALK